MCHKKVKSCNEWPNIHVAIYSVLFVITILDITKTVNHLFYYPGCSLALVLSSTPSKKILVRLLDKMFYEILSEFVKSYIKCFNILLNFVLIRFFIAGYFILVIYIYDLYTLHVVIGIGSTSNTVPSHEPSSPVNQQGKI